MSGVVVVTSDPAVVVAQDNPAISAVVPVAAQPYAYSSLSGLPTLGTAAALNVGVAPNDVVQLDAISRLPPVDGSQLINVASGAVNYLSGLTLSTPGSSANMTVSAGAAMDSTNVDMMTLASAMTKTTSSWVAGSGGSCGSGFNISSIPFYGRRRAGGTSCLAQLEAPMEAGKDHRHEE